MKPNTVESRSREDILEPQGGVEGSRDCKRKLKRESLSFPWRYMDVSKNNGTPKSIFNRDFHYKPSILGYP